MLKYIQIYLNTSLSGGCGGLAGEAGERTVNHGRTRTQVFDVWTDHY
jgi:hypothetical protein